MEKEKAMSSLFSQIDNIQTLALCLGIFVFLSWYFTKPKNNIPPGPFKWPVIGNLPTMILSLFTKEQRHELMTRMGLKYGKIISFNIGSKSTIVLNDAKVIRDAFQKPELCTRPPFPVEIDTAAERRKLQYRVMTFNAHNWQKWKRVFLTCPCHKIYRDEAVGLKSCKYTLKITIFVKM